MKLEGQAGSDLDPRRRKMHYRAWHRGMREMDLVLGRFADAELARLGPQELDEFEALMQAPDPDLFAWILGQTPVPPEQDTPLFRRVVEFSRAGKGAGAQ
jgi:antitoxin CptB